MVSHGRIPNYSSLSIHSSELTWKPNIYAVFDLVTLSLGLITK
jgi:hypothetical protein